MIKVENILIAFYGISTVAVFVIMIIYGGLFDSLHTLLYREISFLISPYSLKETVTVPLYRIYNFNLLMFSIILFVRMHNVFARVGALYLSMSAIFSLFLIQYPMDPLLLSKSVSGSTHIIFVLIAGFYLILSLILFGIAFKKNKNLALLSQYSTEIGLIIMVASFFTAVFALMNMPEYVGLFQKLPIMAFLTWILMTSFKIIKSDNRVKYSAKLKVRKLNK